jgi:arylsulfatase A-like enzyme
MSRQLLGKNSKSRSTDLMWDFGRNKNFNFPGRKENKSPHLAIRRGKWKLLCNDNCTDMELYDLEADRNETKNLADQNPRLARKLAEKVCAWYEENRLKEW